MAGKKMTQRRKLLSRLSVTRPSSTQTSDPPQTPPLHPHLQSTEGSLVYGADDILTCQRDELPHVTRALVNHALGLTESTQSTDALDKLVDLQRTVTTNVLRRILTFRQPNASTVPEPKQLQVDVLHRLVFAQLDTLLVVKTGFGKSIIFQAWMTLLDKISIVIVPLNGLADQIHDDFVAIPGANPIILSGETKQQHVNIYLDILNGNSRGRYTHIITSPEQAVSPEFRQLIRNSYFRSTIGSVVIDEAHCVVMWSTFRSEYAKLYTLQSLLPPTTVLFACTATLTPRLEKHVVRDAGFGRLRPWDPKVNIIRGSVDRPEIGIAVTRLPSRLPQKELLRILKPAIEGVTRVNASRQTTISGELTVVFANTRNKVREICRLFRDVLRQHGYSQGAVVTSVTTYTSRTAKRDRDLRRREMKKPDSKIWILVATTAFGMGLDIPYIRFVYQFEAVLPDIVTQDASDLIPCDIWQRGGRGARGVGVRAIFVIMLQHDIESRERNIETKRMHLIMKSRGVDKPTKKRRGSDRLITTTHTRRNSATADSIGRYETDTESDAQNVDLPPEAEQPEPDKTVDGISAAVQAAEIPDSDVQNEDLTGPRFSWTALIGMSCYRKYFLTHLGEDECRPELKGSSIPTERCCNKCHPALLPNVWYPPEMPESKIESTKPGDTELAGVALPFIHDWATAEMTRYIESLSPNGNPIHRLGGEFLVPQGIQNRLARELYTTAVQGPIQFKRATIDYSTILQDLGFDEAAIGRYRLHIQRNEKAILESFNTGNHRSQASNTKTTTPRNQGDKQRGQMNLGSASPTQSLVIQSVSSASSPEQHMNPASHQVARPSIQSQASQFCRQVLKMNMRNGIVGLVSQPSGLRFESIVGLEVVPRYSAEDSRAMVCLSCSMVSSC